MSLASLAFEAVANFSDFLGLPLVDLFKVAFFLFLLVDWKRTVGSIISEMSGAGMGRCISTVCFKANKFESPYISENVLRVLF
jgi:hypothetical protein